MASAMASKPMPLNSESAEDVDEDNLGDAADPLQRPGSPVPLPPADNLARLEATLEGWFRRVDSKLDALCESCTPACISSTPTNRHRLANGRVLSGSLESPSPEDSQAWRRALIERHKASAQTRRGSTDKDLDGVVRSDSRRSMESRRQSSVAKGRKGGAHRAASQLSVEDMSESITPVPSAPSPTHSVGSPSLASQGASGGNGVNKRGSLDSMASSSSAFSFIAPLFRRGSQASKKDQTARTSIMTVGGGHFLTVTPAPDSNRTGMLPGGGGGRRSMRGSVRASQRFEEARKMSHTWEREEDEEAKEAKRATIKTRLTHRMVNMKMDRGEHEKSTLARIVMHQAFDFTITAVVVLNALLIGANVQHEAVSSTKTNFYEIAEFVCTFIFTFELSLRIYVHGAKFFSDRQERWWNAFDLFLVSISVVDAIVSLSLCRGLCASQSAEEGLSSVDFLPKLLRVFRMARIMRILRTVRFLSQLRIMTHMIVNSMMSLFWIFVILISMIYVFAIILTQGATDYLQMSQDDTSTIEEVDGILVSSPRLVSDYYGSLLHTMYTLFKVTSGGVNWGEATSVMRGPGVGYEAVLVGYVFFTLFAVINIVTGVFVDGAIELAKRDRTVLMQKQMKDNEAKETHLIGLLQALDQDQDEMISAEEFRAGLQRPEVRDFISAMQVEVSDAEAFFGMLDEDGSGEVDVVEFVTGMQRLRGEAKSVDIHMMLHENRKMLKMVGGLVDVVGDYLVSDEAEGSRAMSKLSDASRNSKARRVSSDAISETNSLTKGGPIDANLGRCEYQMRTPGQMGEPSDEMA